MTPADAADDDIDAETELRDISTFLWIRGNIHFG